MQIPDHGRFLGDYIENLLLCEKKEYVADISNCFTCLGWLGSEGSDECIEQLGRFLFDDRDPGFQPLPPGEERQDIYDRRGVTRPIHYEASACLWLALKDKNAFGRSLVGPDGSSVMGFSDKLRQWWLTSAEAAPYRRSLAASGAVLPPGYPPMAELQGSPSTIAPPLKHPPYPDNSPESKKLQAKP